MAFTDTMTRWLEGIVPTKQQWNLRKLFLPLFDRESSVCLSSAGLVITSGGAATAKTGSSDTYILANGVLVMVAASTTLPALVGVITAGKFNVFCFFVDSAGTVTSAMGTEGAAIGNVTFPQFPQGKALLGFLIVTNASTFTGGTTALDGATTTVYINTPSGFDPACLVGSL